MGLSTDNYANTMNIWCYKTLRYFTGKCLHLCDSCHSNSKKQSCTPLQRKMSVNFDFTESLFTKSSIRHSQSVKQYVGKSTSTESYNEISSRNNDNRHLGVSVWPELEPERSEMTDRAVVSLLSVVSRSGTRPLLLLACDNMILFFCQGTTNA